MTAQYQKILGTQAMTARTASIIDELTKASNYDNSHVIDVSTSFGLWDTSATTDGYIKGTIYEATNLILRDTLGCVRLEDLMLVVSAEGAAQLMQSQEIVDYMKGTPDSWKLTQGTLSPTPYGLPPTLFGLKVIVEDSVRVSSHKGGSRVTSWLWPKTTGVICARPGALTAMQGPNFSTAVIFAKEEMTAESFADQRNRRTILSVTEDYCSQVIAPVSGVILTNLFTP